METKFSKGTWSLGRNAHTVITNNGEGFPSPGLGHADIKYYGGYLIAESIHKKADAVLISAAPRMYKALKELTEALSIIGITNLRECKEANEVLKQATDI